MKFVLSHPKTIRGLLSTVPWYLSIGLFWMHIRVHVWEALVGSDLIITLGFLVCIPLIAFYTGYNGLSTQRWTKRRLLWNLIFVVIVGFAGAYVWPMNTLIVKGLCWCLMVVSVRAFDDAYWYFSSDN